MMVFVDQSGESTADKRRLRRKYYKACATTFLKYSQELNDKSDLLMRLNNLLCIKRCGNSMKWFVP